MTQNRLNETTQKLADASKEVKAISDAKDDSDLRIMELEEELHNLRKENETAVAKGSEALSQLENVKLELNAAKTASSDSIEKHQGQENEFNRIIKELQEKINALTVDNEKLKRSYRNLMASTMEEELY